MMPMMPMMLSKLGLLCLASSLVACTVSTDTPLPAIAAALPLPTSPTSPKLPTGPIQLCSGKVDLGLSTPRVTPLLPGWVKVCTTVKNTGTVAWASNASQVAVSHTNTLGGRAQASGFSSLAVGATLEKCNVLSSTGFLRMGHDEPKWGECTATMTVTSKLVFDPDILADGNTANDDCLASNNTRRLTVDFMTACPW